MKSKKMSDQGELGTLVGGKLITPGNGQRDDVKKGLEK